MYDRLPARLADRAGRSEDEKRHEPVGKRFVPSIEITVPPLAGPKLGLRASIL